MSYLRRHQGRETRARLERNAVFGTGMGLILAVVSLFRLHFVAHTDPATWSALIKVGLAMIAVALVMPQAYAGPERLWMAVAQKIGHLVFSLILVVAYYLVVWPVGALMRRQRGTAPIYRWQNEPPKDLEGWIEKEAAKTQDSFVAKEHIRRGFMLRHPFSVLGFFVSRGQMFFVPVLIFLLILGLVLFFVQSSSLAPFIYTLF